VPIADKTGLTGIDDINFALEEIVDQVEMPTEN